MHEKGLKERLKNDEVVLGTWNIISSPALIEVIGYSGLDFVIIDSEHGPVNVESTENLIRAADAIGIEAVVRVPANDSHFILRALDIGACGIQVPHISTKKQAELIVEYAKYHPGGKRGFSPFTRAAGYGSRAESHIKDSNKNTLIVVNIEGVDGIKNLKDIIKVSGIDVIFIGPYDLSQSLGKPGKVGDEDIVRILRESADIVKSKGLACGSFANSIEYLDILIDAGMQYVTYMVDSAFILQSYKELRNFFNRKINTKNE